MRITLPRAVLYKALGHVQDLVERRTTKPILAHVKLETAEGAVRLTATDGALTLEENVEAGIRKDGALTLPARLLYDIVTRLPEDAEVSMDEKDDDGGQVEVACGRTRFSLSTLACDEFPPVSRHEASWNFTLPAAELVALLKRVDFSMSQEESRSYLNGVYLHPLQDEAVAQPTLRVVATDGHRMAVADASLPQGAADIPGVIVPRKSVLKLRKLAEDQEEAGVLRFALSEKDLLCAFPRMAVTTQLVEAKFPDYRRVIPPPEGKLMEVSADAFADAVGRVATVVLAERVRAVRVKLAGNRLTLSATGREHDYATEEIEASGKDGDFEIAYNARYLLDVAEQFRGGVMRFLIPGENKPTVLRSPEESAFFYVLMPMRI